MDPVTVAYPFAVRNHGGSVYVYTTRALAEAAARAAVNPAAPSAIVYEAVALIEVQPTPVKVSPVSVPL